MKNLSRKHLLLAGAGLVVLFSLFGDSETAFVPSGYQGGFQGSSMQGYSQGFQQGYPQATQQSGGWNNHWSGRVGSGNFNDAGTAGYVHMPSMTGGSGTTVSVGL